MPIGFVFVQASGILENFGVEGNKIHEDAFGSVSLIDGCFSFESKYLFPDAIKVVFPSPNIFLLKLKSEILGLDPESDFAVGDLFQ